MSIIIDILGSTFIGGMILMLLLQMNMSSSNASYSSDTELKLQQNAKTLAEVLNYDLRKVGYNYKGTAVITADSTRIKFYADMQAPGTAGYGVVDVVEYFLTDSTKATGTANPKDKVLVRVLNGTDSLSGPSLGLVKLRFSYLNSKSIKTTALDSIRYIKTELWVESADMVENRITEKAEYPFTYWEFTIYPRNI